MMNYLYILFVICSCFFFLSPTTTLCATTLNIRDFGAIGDGKAYDGTSIQRALASCAAASPTWDSPCTVLAPSPGVYLTGSLEILSNNTALRVSAGAVLLGSTSAAHFGITGPLPSYPVRSHHNSSPRFQALVSAARLANVSVEGGGTIDARGRAFSENPENNATREYQRPCVLEFLYCAGVAVEGVRLLDGAYYHVHPYASRGVRVEGVRIEGFYHNADGIDPDSCSDVEIRGCDVATGDDCVSLKSGLGSEGVAFGVPTERVVIANNTFRVGSGVAIGSEMSGGVRQVRVAGNRFDAVVNVVRFKSCPHYAGVVENVTYSNNTLRAGVTAVYVDMHYECASDPNATLPDPLFRDVRVQGLEGDSVAAGTLMCLQGGCDAWVFEDVRFHKHLLGYVPCENVTNSVCQNCSPIPSCFINQ